MKGYMPEEIREVFKQRARILSEIELANFRVSEKNRQIGELFEKYYSGKKYLQFSPGNKVNYITDNGVKMQGVPYDMKFVLVHIDSNVAYDEVIYRCQEEDSERFILIKQEDFHSFTMFDSLI